jgi:hypothetical protein
MKQKLARGIDIIEHIERYLMLPYGVRRTPEGEFLTKWEPFGPGGPIYWVSDTIQEIGE